MFNPNGSLRLIDTKSLVDSSLELTLKAFLLYMESLVRFGPELQLVFKDDVEFYTWFKYILFARPSRKSSTYIK